MTVKKYLSIWIVTLLVVVQSPIASAQELSPELQGKLDAFLAGLEARSEAEGRCFLGENLLRVYKANWNIL